MKPGYWLAAIGVILVTSALSNTFGGDEVEHARATALTVADRAAESRHLAAEARMQREILVAGSRP